MKDYSKAEPYEVEVELRLIPFRGCGSVEVSYIKDVKQKILLEKAGYKIKTLRYNGDMSLLTSEGFPVFVKSIGSEEESISESFERLFAEIQEELNRIYEIFSDVEGKRIRKDKVRIT